MKCERNDGIRMRAVAGVSMSFMAAVLLVGCVSGSQLKAQRQQIQEQAEQIHDRAYRCSPRELALAKAHEEFGRAELNRGNGRRGQDHVLFADEMIKEADARSLHTLCLDPSLQDRDGDGIIDSEDLCPDTPGLREFQGCPDPDPDKDGVCDAWVSEMGLLAEFAHICKGIDHCPTVPGELAYYGCPNPDSDGDGICDPWVSQMGLDAEFAHVCKGSDLCPHVKGTPEFFGCPNPDSDGDGVCDPWVSEMGLSEKFAHICQGVDQCPFEKGTLEDNGCPPPRKYIEVTENKIELKEQFFFATNKTQVLAKSVPLLDEIAAVLRENPSINIAIEGHTDSTGRRNSNLTLSKGRAKSVMQELIKRGISADRMTSEGFGPDRPIDTNDTADGRAKNRRVDINITKR